MTNFLTTAQVAQRLGKSDDTVRRLVATGDLRATKLPGRTGAFVITEADLADYLSAATSDGAA